MKDESKLNFKEYSIKEPVEEFPEQIASDWHYVLAIIVAIILGVVVAGCLIYKILLWVGSH